MNNKDWFDWFDLIDWFVLCLLFVSRDAGVWRWAGWRGGGGVWREAASMWLPHHVHRHHPQPGAEEWRRHWRRPPQTQQQGEERCRWWQLGVTVVVGVVFNGMLLPWKMALTVVVGVVFNRMILPWKMALMVVVVVVLNCVLLPWWFYWTVFYLLWKVALTVVLVILVNLVFQPGSARYRWSRCWQLLWVTEP